MPEDLADSPPLGVGEPLVLLHGLNMSGSAWSPLIGDLQRSHTVFAPTLAGHRGGPTLREGPDCMGTMADELELQLDALGWDRAHFVGNSLGGWLALELAARGRAVSVVAFSPAGAWTTNADLRRLSRLLRLMRITAGSEAVAGLLQWSSSRRLLLRYAMEHGDRVPPDVAAGFFADTTASTAMDPLRAWAKGRLSIQPLPTHGARVRIAWPRHDRLIPWNRYGVPFRQISPGAEFVFLEGVGHVPMYDDTDLVVRTIVTHTLEWQSWRRCTDW